MDEAGQGRATRAMPDGGSEDEAETTVTWRAYRATTFDSEDTVNSGNAAAQKGAKPSPAEVGTVNKFIPKSTPES